jgi:predicted AlkP superfamily pyrophosphatase or phosphodiesterase
MGNRSSGKARVRWALVAFASLVIAGLAHPEGAQPQEASLEQREAPGRRPDAPPPPQKAKKVLLIGIDGVRPDILADVSTPHIDSLIANGAFSDSAYTARPTISGPGWSSMLTGVWPAKHGVVTNNFRGNRYDQYPDFLTRMERLRPELNTFVAADWLPLVSETSGGPLFGDAPDVKVVLNGYDLGWDEADEQTVDATVEHLQTADPDALFVYLGNPDETSHHTGSIGEEYRDAIELADRQVGRLIDAVRARPTYADEDWLILVSTDHGRRPDGGHGSDSPEEKTIFLLMSGPSAAGGRIPGTPAIVDVAATALAHLGISLDPAWGLDGVPVGLTERP